MYKIFSNYLRLDKELKIDLILNAIVEDNLTNLV